MQRYQRLDLIGSGAYSKVYLGLDNWTGADVALKVLKGDAKPKAVTNELKVLAELTTTDIAVKFITSYQDLANTVIVTEYLRGYTVLADVPRSSFTASRIAELSAKLIAALHALHQVGVAHRDIQMGNIMLELKTFNIKFIDFGFACLADDMTPFMGGTPNYYYPGIRFQCHHNIQSYQLNDRWALATVVYKLITNTTPFELYRQTLDIDEAKKSILHQLYSIGRDYSKDLYASLFDVTEYKAFAKTYPIIANTVQQWFTIE